VLYPISAAPGYPTAAQIQTFLNKSRITETQLSVEHVEMLLNVLILDGEVEKVRTCHCTA
jgi:DNA-directed RNA polymerase III subunit RPC6